LVAACSPCTANAPTSQAQTSMATKKGYPARSQISASRSLPVYHSPLSYAALSGHGKPRTHANMTVVVAEDVNPRECDAGRTPVQVTVGMDGYREYQVQHQLQQRTAITSLATSPVTPTTATTTAEPSTMSIVHVSGSSPSSSNSSNSTNTSVESAPLQTPVQDYEEE